MSSIQEQQATLSLSVTEDLREVPRDSRLLFMQEASQELLSQMLLLLEQQGERLAALEGAYRVLQAQVDEGHKTTPYIHDNPFYLMPDPAGKVGMVIGYDEGASSDASETYRSFEELFRGPVERVLQLQKPYIELLRGHQPVLDVGCGRGELIKLLAEENIEAQGVDMDEGMARVGQAEGLDITVGDANSFLSSCSDESLGAVFSAQVIEHMPYQQLIDFFRLSFSKLQPGGVFIAETVNPHRPASMKTFWTDLTHQHPIFPEVALAQVRAAGFQAAHLFFPTGSGDANQDLLQADAYSVVAYKLA